METDIAILIEEAKLKVIKSYEGKDSTRREWLESHCDSYENPKYRLALLVLEGSPAKGAIIINYGRGTVKAFDHFFNLLKTFRTGRHEQ